MLNEKQQKKASEALDLYAEAMKDSLPEGEYLEMKKLSTDVIGGSKTATKKVSAKKEKGTREPTPRNNFMGSCMRGVDKGGEGRPMGDCSSEWKDLPQELKDTYVDDAGE
ncbi:MAG: hypothetical protein KAJ39_06350 [Gammaproteobacteria bacterium]|nr:hypothetical protein [Gammaproteobacteria bacterium]